MNARYDHPTAHRLDPVKGWDAMSHMDFVAEMDSSVSGACAGTVMHMDSTSGKLKTGLDPQGMGLFLFFKQYDDDTVNNPVTLDGTNLTSISMNSSSGMSHYPVLNAAATGASINGVATNLAPYDFTAGGTRFTAASSVHTTWPGACGMELSNTEFAQVDTSGASITYNVNDVLTSPQKPASAYTAAPGTAIPGTLAQVNFGGFLQKGSPYVDPICGVVSRKVYRNVHGVNVITYWAEWLPKLTTAQFNTISTAWETDYPATPATP